MEAVVVGPDLSSTSTLNELILIKLLISWAQSVKNLPAMWETWVQSLGWETPLEEGMAIHSSLLAWTI